MSTTNHVYCRDHQQRVYAFDGPNPRNEVACFGEKEQDALVRFLMEHRGCTLVCRSEYADVIDEKDGKERSAYEFTEEGKDHQAAWEASGSPTPPHKA